ncbi:transposase, MuDR, MULE transposase domain protein [Tanacetum coccineum]
MLRMVNPSPVVYRSASLSLLVVRIIPGPAGLVQRAKLLKDNVFILDLDEALMSTQKYMQKVVEDVGEDANFNSGAWVSATNYVKAFGGNVNGCLGDIDNLLKKGKMEQVVAIVKSCSSNALGDLNVTLKDLSGTVPGTINYKVLDVGGYEKDITVGAAMILANVLVFTPKPSKHYLNITKKMWLRFSVRIQFLEVAVVNIIYNLSVHS